MNKAVSFTPTVKQLDEIKVWLIAEQEKSGVGFYCNWKQIERAFTENKMGIVLAGAKPVGFVTWEDWSVVYRIGITEIKPSYRKKGYGKLLIEALEKHLISKGVSVLRLHCQPSLSEEIWKRMGFMEFPLAKSFADENGKAGKHLYKVIVASQSTATELVFGGKIELWDVQPYEIKQGIEPKWTWEVVYKENSHILSLPIIAPANTDWMIRWSKNGSTIAEDKVKYFLNAEIDEDDFILVTELNAPPEKLRSGSRKGNSTN